MGSDMCELEIWRPQNGPVLGMWSGGEGKKPPSWRLLGGSREMPRGPLDSNTLALPGFSGCRDKPRRGPRRPVWSPPPRHVPVTGTAVRGVVCSELAQYLNDFLV